MTDEQRRAPACSGDGGDAGTAAGPPAEEAAGSTPCAVPRAVKPVAGFRTLRQALDDSPWFGALRRARESSPAAEREAGEGADGAGG